MHGFERFRCIARNGGETGGEGGVGNSMESGGERFFIDGVESVCAGAGGEGNGGLGGRGGGGGGAGHGWGLGLWWGDSLVCGCGDV